MQRKLLLIAFGASALVLAALASATALRSNSLPDDRPTLARADGAAAPLAALAAADSEAEASLLTKPLRRTLVVRSGDTLMTMLTGTGISRGEAHTAIAAMRPLYRPTALRPGQEIEVTMRPDTSDPGVLTLEGLRLLASVHEEIRIARDSEGSYAAEAIERPTEVKLVRRDGAIASSLFLAGQRAEVPPPVLVEVSRVFGFDLDFQRDIQPGDRFSVLYERIHDETGQPVETGNVVLAEMVVRDKPIRLYRFESGDGLVDFYDAKGKSVRKALMITPIDGARISSGFGKRRHPILGYTKMHRGIDFAAPRGTPIYAAGHGTVEYAGRNGGYGKYIRIRHTGTYKTAYAHLNGFARGLRTGARVHQGQVIGYVGSTGRSTGPHLHYEILKNDRQVNPKSIKLPSGRALAGDDLIRFRKFRDGLEAQYATLTPRRQLAARPGDDTGCHTVATC